MGQVKIKSEKELAGLRAACRLAAATLEQTAPLIVEGITTNEINQFVHRFTLQHGGKPAPLNYHGYPKSICTSINEVICHGIPSKRKLKNGDIINVDITTILDGWHGDVSAMFYVGTPSEIAKTLVETTRECLRLAIAQVKPGARLGDIGAAIQRHAEGHGFSVVRDFVGHGIGRGFHEEPQVPHFGQAGRGLRLEKGMTFTIEPMINQGVWHMRILEDTWTAVTADGLLSAQFEHTVAVTEDGVEVLTAFGSPLLHSEVFPQGR